MEPFFFKHQLKSGKWTSCLVQTCPWNLATPQPKRVQYWSLPNFLPLSQICKVEEALPTVLWYIASRDVPARIDSSIYWSVKSWAMVLHCPPPLGGKGNPYSFFDFSNHYIRICRISLGWWCHWGILCVVGRLILMLLLNEWVLMMQSAGSIISV